MICGEEEWKHCRAEKMGCEGCHYDFISKTKIRKFLKNKAAIIYGIKVIAVEDLLEFLDE
jgi:hypothetical protein